jgi:hypothetical protein
MSHFTVLVITDSHDEVEDALAPFQENNMGDCPMKYMEFHDTAEEFRVEYAKNDSYRKWVNESGVTRSPYDEFFRLGNGSMPNEPPPGYVERMVPIQETYPTFELFVQEWHGHSGPDEDTGEYGYWFNPNAKWDWWLIGGRWRNFFKVKPRAISYHGDPGVFNRDEEAKEDFADAATKDSIDIEWMRDNAASKAAVAYDSYQSAVSGHPPIILWDDIRAKHPDNKEGIDKARKEYHDQSGIVALNEAKINTFFSGPEDYQCTREEYIERAKAQALGTFAVLKDGQWYEKGSVGWWGMVADEKEEDVWTAEFAKLIDDLPDDKWLTVVDCHI